MRGTPIGSSLLVHAALAGGLVLSRSCAVHAGDGASAVVELAIVPVVAAPPTPPAAEVAPSPASDVAPAPGDHVAEEERPHRGGGGGHSTETAAPAPRPLAPPAQDAPDDDSDTAASAEDVPHATLAVAAPAGELSDLDLGLAGPRPNVTPGTGTGGGRGGGEGGGVGNGRGGGQGRAARRGPRPLNAREHTVLPYPEVAVQWQVSGTVRLLLTVGADGLVHDVTVTERLGYGLDRIAVAEARKLRFEPGLDVDGQPIAMRVRWTYTFEPP